MKFIQPAKLKPGDKVAIVSPSSGMAFLFPWVYKQGLAELERTFELIPIEFPTACKSSEYLSKNPKARAEDINNAFADPMIKAIIATTGGNDQIRILPYLDKEIISRNPKIFMGYSDCTNLHLFLWNLGIISYYGGAIMSQFAMNGGMQEYTVRSLKSALFNPPIGKVQQALEYSDADLEWGDKENLSKKLPMYPGMNWIWHNCHEKLIEGRLWGGCLEVLDLHLSVKHYLPKEYDLFNESILYLETSEEMPSEGFVYRFFAALGELGILKKLKAILVGCPKAQFMNTQPPEGRESFIINQQNAIKRALKDYHFNAPVIFNINFGHTDPQIIVPNGGNVIIDCTLKTIVFN